MIKEVDFSKVSSEFYYFDGVDFRRCLTLSSVEDFSLDKNVEDNLFYFSKDGVENLLGFSKIKDTCKYYLEKAESFLYILTENGWEMIVTEDMDIRNKDLEVYDKMNIIIKPSINIVPDERVTFDKFGDGYKVEFKDIVNLINKEPILIVCNEVVDFSIDREEG